MHAAKGQNQKLFIKLAPGNQMEASVRFFFLFLFREWIKVCLRRMNQLVNVKQSFMTFKYISFLYFKMVLKILSIKCSWSANVQHIF